MEQMRNWKITLDYANQIDTAKALYFAQQTTREQMTTALEIARNWIDDDFIVGNMDIAEHTILIGLIDEIENGKFEIHYTTVYAMELEKVKSIEEIRELSAYNDMLYIQQIDRINGKWTKEEKEEWADKFFNSFDD